MKVTKYGKRVTANFECDVCGSEFSEVTSKCESFDVERYYVCDSEVKTSYIAKHKCPLCGMMTVTSNIIFEDRDNVDAEIPEGSPSFTKEQLDLLKKAKGEANGKNEEDPFRKICPKWGTN